jgi:NADH:ubiquinone oxidoreductase subunit 5 (subunit L)/multisubunit Na+/H+ antiporter MnhA subunit
MSIALISALPAVMAVLMATIRRSLPRVVHVWGLAGFVGILFFVLLSYLPTVTEQGAILVSIPWVPQLGLTISLVVDGLSLLFSLIVVGIGAVIVLYAGYYFEPDQTVELNRFYVLLFMFMSAMLALVLAGNVIMLFIAWEATSVVSFLLISFNSEKPEARKGALQALIVTGGGGLALLVGLVMLGTVSGSMELSAILTQTDLNEHPLYNAIAILILLGCFSKSAQFPLHFWLPGAMSAPTPASAYLHSATMVKAGIYLLLRLYPALGNSALWANVLLIVGLATMFIAAVFALRQRDLKALLAYSTVSQLGAIVAMISLPEGHGIQAALVSILAHSMYKAALFMVAGAIDHITGTRDITKLGGLFSEIPGWAIVTGLAGLSMAGLPPFLGFVAKENLFEALYNTPIALLTVLFSAALTVAVAMIFLWDVFFKRPEPIHHDDHDHHLHLHHAPVALLFAPAVLAAGSLLTGLQLDTFVKPLISPSVEHLHLYLFSGFTTAFALSVVAILGGAAIFGTRGIWRGWNVLNFPTGTSIYNTAVTLVETFADLLLRSQGGKLRHYLVVILGAVIALQAMGGFIHVTGHPIVLEFRGGVDVLRGGLLLLAAGTMFASILYKRHLIAALALGVSGYSVGGLFLLEPAPDVALVQFMVETLGTVLLIIMLARIRADERQRAMDALWHQSRAGLIRDVAISAAVGIGVGMFALAAVISRPKPESIATWHLENTMALVGFPDVVGAIVTDFRGMDTVIEISVFSVAALGVLTILAKPAKRAPRPGSNADKARATQTQTMEMPEAEPSHELEEFVSSLSTPLTRVVSSMVLPFAFLVALTQLLYGGEAPGDGFTAGVISGLGVTLWYVVFGYHEARKRLHWLPERALIGAGLTLVILNGLYPLLTGNAFMAHIGFDIPLPAGLHLSTTMIYETGIFLTVLGSVSTILEAIAYPKEVEPL